jgi:hypothetical protein
MAVLDVLAAEDGIAQQGGGLEPCSRLAPQRWNVVLTSERIGNSHRPGGIAAPEAVISPAEGA